MIAIKDMDKEVAKDNLKADIKYWENTSVSVDHLYMAINAIEKLEQINQIINKQVILPEGKIKKIKEVLKQDNVDKTCDNCKYHTDAEEIHGKTPCGTCGHEHINFVERVKL